MSITRRKLLRATIDNVVDKLDINANNVDQKWHDIISLMDSKVSDKEGERSILQKEVRDGTIIDTIQNDADVNGIAEGDTSSIIGKLSEQIAEKTGEWPQYSELLRDIYIMEESSDQGFWNQSVADAVNYIASYVGIKNNLNHLPTEFANEYLEILKPAVELENFDAGLNFKVEQGNEPQEKWVYPDGSVDSTSVRSEFTEDVDAAHEKGTSYRKYLTRTYEDVRNAEGQDIAPSAISNFHNTQFTHTQNKDTSGETYVDNGEDLNGKFKSKWLRLIMPKYSKRVEIEDLNRNFWVISDLLACICNYLFSDDNPIATSLNYLVKEIAELWENIYYLWMLVAKLKQRNADSVHVEVVPLPVGTLYPEKKYDNFGFYISSTTDDDDLLNDDGIENIYADYVKYSKKAQNALSLYGKTLTDKDNDNYVNQIKTALCGGNSFDMYYYSYVDPFLSSVTMSEKRKYLDYYEDAIFDGGKFSKFHKDAIDSKYGTDDEYTNEVIEEVYNFFDSPVKDMSRSAYGLLCQDLINIRDGLFATYENDITKTENDEIASAIEKGTTDGDTDDQIQAAVKVIQDKYEKEIASYESKFNNIIAGVKERGYLLKALTSLNKKEDYDSDLDLNKLFYENDAIVKRIIDRIDYIKDNYAGQDVCVIPFIRVNNYMRNYYSGAFYPYMFVYSYNQKHWNWFKLLNGSKKPIFISLFEGGGDFNSPSLGPFISGVKENDYSYTYMQPFSLSGQINTVNPCWYYGAVRVLPEVKVYMAPSRIIVPEEGIKLCLHDAPREMYRNESLLVSDFTVDIEASGGQESDGYVSKELYDGTHGYESSGEFILPYERNIDNRLNVIKDKTILYNDENSEQRFYMGELISWHNSTTKKTPEEQQKDKGATRIKVVNIGNFVYTDGTNEDYHAGDAKYGVGSFTKTGKTSINSGSVTFVTPQKAGEMDLIAQSTTSVLQGRTTESSEKIYTNDYIKKRGQEVLEYFYKDTTGKAVLKAIEQSDSTTGEGYRGADNIASDMYLSNTDQDCFIITHIGLEPWMTSSDEYKQIDKKALCKTVWYKGMYGDIFYWDATAKTVTHVCSVDRAEGFFTRDETIFTREPGGSRSREVRFVSNSSLYNNKDFSGYVYVKDQIKNVDRFCFNFYIKDDKLTFGDKLLQNTDGSTAETYLTSFGSIVNIGDIKESTISGTTTSPNYVIPSIDITKYNGAGVTNKGAGTGTMQFVSR